MNEEGDFLPHDGKTVGEIVGRGPWMTQGYFKDPENSEQLWKNGWLHTGDVGSIDEEDYLTISDRMKDVIKTGGEWVCSLDIENIISQIEGVSEVAVVGIPDNKWGERPFALIVPKTGYAEILHSEDIKNYIRQLVESGKINKWYIPDQIDLVAEIPKTSVGKIDKKKIRNNLKTSNQV